MIFILSKFIDVDIICYRYQFLQYWHQQCCGCCVASDFCDGSNHQTNHQAHHEWTVTSEELEAVPKPF